MPFTYEQRLEIERVKANLHRVEDRKCVEHLIKIINELERKIQAQEERAYGNGEYVRELQELNRAYENRLGYY